MKGFILGLVMALSVNASANPVVLIPLVVQGITRISGGIVFTTIVRNGSQVTVNTKFVEIAASTRAQQVETIISKQLLQHANSVVRAAMPAEQVIRAKVVDVGERSLAAMKMYSVRPDLALRASGRGVVEMVSTNYSRVPSLSGTTRTFSIGPRPQAAAPAPKGLEAPPEVPLSVR